MKILQIAYSLAPGGAERFVVDLCNELCKVDTNEIYLVTINDDTSSLNRHYLKELSSKVKYICLGCKKGLSFESIRKTYGIIKKIKPDIVHSHTKLIPLYLPSLFLKRPRYIHTLHSLAEKAVSFTRLRFLERYLFKRNVQPVTISSFNQQSYRKFYELENSVCINNGCPVKQTTDELENVRTELETLKQGMDVPVFIHVARYNKAKNQQLLFNVFNKLADEGYKFLLIILGSGFENTCFVNKQNEDCIKFLGPKQNVGDYLNCSKYFVLTSKWEGLPISLIEAMSVGCIPISTPAGGVVDVIRNKENGYLTETFSEDEMYMCIKDAIQGKCCIDNSRVIDSYNASFTMGICARNYFALYQNVIDKK